MAAQRQPAGSALAEDVRRLRPEAVVTDGDAASLALGDVKIVAPADAAPFSRVLVVGDDVEVAAALAAHGLYRRDAQPLASGAWLAERASASDAVCFYETLVARLRREIDVYHRVALEYRAAAHERDLIIDRIDPDPVGREAHLPPQTPVFELVEDLVSLRWRFAPPASLRTRAVDAATRLAHAGATSILRLFDYRDAAIARARRR